jgi:hypothetical protein
VKTSLARVLLWYAYMGALVSALYAAGVKFTWGMGLLANLVFSLLFLSAWTALLANPPELVGLKTRSKVLDGAGVMGAAFVVQAATNLPRILSEVTVSASYTIIIGAVAVGITAWLTCAVLRVRQSSQTEPEHFGVHSEPKIL